MRQAQRRRFLSAAGALLASPIVRAQQPVRMRRVGILLAGAEDSMAKKPLDALRENLQQLGWREGRNLEMEVRWADGKAALMRTHALELVKSAPEVIVVQSATALREVGRATDRIPIVFFSVSDPLGNKFVQNLARPGGNITGFSLFEYEMGGKWLQLLKEIVPSFTRAALLQNVNNPNWPGWLRAIEPIAPSLGLQLVLPNLTTGAQIEPAITAFAREPNGGLLILPDPFLRPHYGLILKLAAKYRLPTVSGSRVVTQEGGLVSYDIDRVDLAGRAADYVSRILRGEKPGNLPVQAPTKFELLINLKTAKTLGLTIPQSILLRADRVIE